MSNTKNELFVFARATAKKGEEKALEAALREVAGPTRKQSGCVEFLLVQKSDEPNVIIGLEHWKSSEDHQRHLKGAHVKKLMEQMGPVLAGAPDIVVYTVIDG